MIPMIDLTFSRNGYDREEAIHYLARMKDGSELPYLLPRLNDWVPQVRNAAKKAVLARVRPDYAEHFVRNLAILARVREGKRDDHRPLLESIARIASEHARPALVAALRDPDPRVRRLAFDMLGDDVEEALQSNDFVLRLKALRRLTPSAELLERMLSDPWAAVRREALRMELEQSPNDENALRRALLDRSASLRDEARFLLRSRAEVDPAAIYREALAAATTPSRLATAIDGLGETGSAADVEPLRKFLQHESARVRRSTLRAIARLGRDESVPVILPMLADHSSAVSALARNELTRRAVMIDVPALLALLERADSPHIRGNIVAVIAALPKWDAITALLTIDAKPWIARWFTQYNRNSAVPTRAQLQRLDEVMRNGNVDRDTLEQLRFAIKPFEQTYAPRA